MTQKLATELSWVETLDVSSLAYAYVCSVLGMELEEEEVSICVLQILLRYRSWTERATGGGWELKPY